NTRNCFTRRRFASPADLPKLSFACAPDGESLDRLPTSRSADDTPHHSGAKNRATRFAATSRRTKALARQGERWSSRRSNQQGSARPQAFRAERADLAESTSYSARQVARWLAFSRHPDRTADSQRAVVRAAPSHARTRSPQHREPNVHTSLP